jgi:hypothetical protein
VLADPFSRERVSSGTDRFLVCGGRESNGVSLEKMIMWARPAVRQNGSPNRNATFS